MKVNDEEETLHASQNAHSQHLPRNTQQETFMACCIQMYTFTPSKKGLTHVLMHMHRHICCAAQVLKLICHDWSHKSRFVCSYTCFQRQRSNYPGVGKIGSFHSCSTELALKDRFYLAKFDPYDLTWVKKFKKSFCSAFLNSTLQSRFFLSTVKLHK